MVDVIIAFRLQDLRGGDHVGLNWDGSSALIIETSELGTIIAGGLPSGFTTHTNA